jgi:hypothetical protein
MLEGLDEEPEGGSEVDLPGRSDEAVRLSLDEAGEKP